MLFKEKDLSIAKINSIQLAMWLKAILKRKTGHDYQIYVKTKLMDNTIMVEIDETVMTTEQYDCLVNLYTIDYFAYSEQILGKILNDVYRDDYKFKFFATGLENIYIIRELVESNRNKQNNMQNRRKNRGDDCAKLRISNR